MKRALGILSSLSLAMLCGSAAHARDLPNINASFDGRAGRPPAFVWGSRASAALPIGASPAQAAAAHLAAHAALYGLSPAALATAGVAHVHDTGRGGIVVTLRQSIGGVPLFEHDAKVLLRRDLSLVALSGGLHPRAVDAPKAAGHFKLSYAEAVAAALSDLGAASFAASALTANATGVKGEYRPFDLASGKKGALRFDRPARARKVYFAKGAALVPAYHAEVFTAEGKEHSDFAYVIAAETGEVLMRRDLRQDAAFKYRVWADTTGDFRPMDGPVADFTPHPTGKPDGSFPSPVAPSLVSIDGLNKTMDPWLPSDATQTTGNNVDAYTDHDDSNDATAPDVHATLTAMGELDRVYDTSKAPLDSTEQEMAAVTQLFYTTNWLHDYWYDSGFDEAAGNAQMDNYGRGGMAGDPLLVEAQDAFDKGATNNANMSTPADGESPRMQMYVWDGKETRSITVQPGNSTLQSGAADFGPQSFNVTGDVVLVDDGAGTKTDACEAILNNVSGKIALIDRGMCTFQSKAVMAEAAGAIGVILANNQSGAPPAMPGDGSATVNIPMMSLTKADGATIKAALGQGAVTATLARVAGVDVDGTIDNLIVSHEWGHYLHHRLVPGCNFNQCGGQSEGWGDFVALTTQLREGDNLDGAFSDSTYAASALDNYAYFGVRRFPYSTDMNINPLTFQHIQQSATIPSNVPMADVFPDPSEVHNTGEVWAAMMFEGFVAMLKQSQGATPKYTFEEARRRMADYVVAGMQLAPSEPTFTQQRDGVIAAALAADKDDALLIAQGFAKRGAGSCAVSPPSDSPDNEGVVESFDVGPAIAVPVVKIDDSAMSCDLDGVLDAHETGLVTVKIANRSFLPAPETKVSISSKAPGVTFPGGATTTVPMLDGLAETTLTFQITIDPAQMAPEVVDVTITADNPAACAPTVVDKQVIRTNYDNKKESSTTDDFESAFDVWKRSGMDAESIWDREADDKGNHVWHGVDFGSLSDTSLVSPALTVSSAEDLVMSFRHRYTFEASPSDPNDPQSPLEYWDGAVIEISADDGATWEDVSQYVDPGYTGTIGNQAMNPLANREGYTDRSAGWPGMDMVSLNFGKALAGETVKVRFRIGTDQAAGESGWEIDDVGFTGIVGTPFPSIVADPQICTPAVDHAPIADAGPDQVVNSGAKVTLDASKSSDPDGDALSFSWSQAEGTGILLSSSGAKASFTAPDVEQDTLYSFAVRVTAKDLSSVDTVKVLVKSTKTSDVLASGGGCGCSVPGNEKAPGLPLGALGAAALGLMAARRRRK